MGDLFLLAMTGVCPQVTLVDSSWVVVAGGLTGVDFIPMKFLAPFFIFPWFLDAPFFIQD